jgi:hypothetical protein
VFGIEFASAALSQELQEKLIPIGAMPIAVFATKATETSSEIIATTATFAETGSSLGTIFTFAYF